MSLGLSSACARLQESEKICHSSLSSVLWWNLLFSVLSFERTIGVLDRISVEEVAFSQDNIH